MARVSFSQETTIDAEWNGDELQERLPAQLGTLIPQPEPARRGADPSGRAELAPDPEEDGLEIKNLVLAKEYRGDGLGRSVIRASPSSRVARAPRA